MNIKYAITNLLFISTCLISCGGESSNAPASEEDPKGSEIPCDEQNEGLIIKPADSETERLCKDGAWVELPSSSESVSSSSDVSSSSLEASSSSITSSSSSLDISSSSAETEGQISSSSEETKMFLCEDGVTYVLDLANCDVESSSSDALLSSSEERLLTYSGGCVADVTAKIQPHGCLAKALLLTAVYKAASPQM